MSSAKLRPFCQRGDELRDKMGDARKQLFDVLAAKVVGEIFYNKRCIPAAS